MSALQKPLPPLPENPLRLPAWKALAETLIAHGITYGDMFPVEYMEAWLGKRGGMAYQMAVFSLRKRLEKGGFYLIERESGNCEIVMPEANVRKCVARFKQSKTLLVRGLALGTATDKTGLSADDKEKLEGINQKTATRLALIGRKELA